MPFGVDEAGQIDPHNLRGWPDDRFDMAWVITRDTSGAPGFAQVPQRLLEGDSSEAIAC